LKFTSAELEIIKQYPYKSQREVLQLLPTRCIDSVRKKAHKLGLTREPKPKWTKKEENILKKFHSIAKKDLKEMLPRHSWKAIKLKLNDIGLSRPRFTEISQATFTDVDRGWLAALIDSEGSIGAYIANKRLIIPRISIANTCKELMQRTKNILGSEGTIQCVRPSKYGWKPCYIIHIFSIPRIHSILKQLEPLLIAKKEQAKVMIRFCESRFQNKK